jgi:hypothetical protein
MGREMRLMIAGAELGSAHDPMARPGGPHSCYCPAMNLPAWLLAPLFRPGEKPPRSPVGVAPPSLPVEQVPRPFLPSPIGTAARAPRPRSARRPRSE